MTYGLLWLKPDLNGTKISTITFASALSRNSLSPAVSADISNSAAPKNVVVFAFDFLYQSFPENKLTWAITG